MPPTSVTTHANFSAGKGHLAHLPLPLFAAPMGFGGAGLAWRGAAHVLEAPALVGEMLLATALLTWLMVTLLHIVRAVLHPGALIEDLRHPVRSAFAGAFTIGLMILAAGLFRYAPEFARGLWLATVGLHVGIGVWTLRGLVTAPREPAALTPPLLIPLVGNVLAPTVGATLGFPHISWMLFGVGVLLWALVQPAILYRLIVGPPLPPRLRPSLVILLAPPSVALIAMERLTGQFGDAALAVFGFAGVTALALATLAWQQAKIPFAVSWWAWTFPTAAFAMATQSYAHAFPAPLATVLAWAVLIVATGLLAIVAAATLRAAWLGHLIAPES
ncbi:MAG: C4-dicarboxylate ABC transporter [Pseudomonadota bacterium]